MINLNRFSEKITNWIGSTQSIILHSIFFVGIFALHFAGFATSDILLVLTTLVSLEAIYLAIFIQMTVNRNTQSLEEVEEDIDVIQGEVKGLGEDIEEISEDVDKNTRSLEDVGQDIEEVVEGVEELEQKIREEGVDDQKTDVTIENIHTALQKLLADVETLKQQKTPQ